MSWRVGWRLWGRRGDECELVGMVARMDGEGIDGEEMGERGVVVGGVVGVEGRDDDMVRREGVFGGTVHGVVDSDVEVVDVDTAVGAVEMAYIVVGGVDGKGVVAAEMVEGSIFLVEAVLLPAVVFD